MEGADDSPESRGLLRGQVQECVRLESLISHFSSGTSELCASLRSTGLDPCYVRDLLSESDSRQLNMVDLFAQLNDFAENMQHQVQELVIGPLGAYQEALGGAVRRARAVDEESEALDAAQLKYLSHTRDSLIEARAHAQQDLDDKSAAMGISLFDLRCSLRDACAKQRVLPQRALGELLVAQLAYH